MEGLRLPDFFIVGHAKCGTTALTKMLKAHPRISIPVKEPRYFAPELRTRYWRPRSNREKRPRTLEAYGALFAGIGPDQMVGEATPSYLRSATAAASIAQVCPDARIVAILREPTAFLRSLHLQLLRNYDENQKSFRRALELEPLRKQGRRMPPFSQAPSGLLYTEHVRYVEQLKRFHDAFGHERVLVLIYDDLRADNERTVRQVLEFFDLEAGGFAVPQAELDPLKMPRSVILDQVTRLAAYAPHNRILNPLLKAGAKTGVGRLGPLWKRAVYEENPLPEEELMLALRRRFKGEVEAASEYLGRDLVALWGYDRLD
jgi:Sulfotransferase family